MRLVLALALRAAAPALAALALGGAAAAQDAAQDAAAPSAFSETHGAWTVRCADAAAAEDEASGGERRCAMEQRFVWRDPETGQDSPLLTVTLTPVPGEGETVAILATAAAPFGLRVAPGLRLSADEAEGTVLAFLFCMPDGCVAQAQLTPETLWSFRAGVVLNIEAQPAAGGEPFRVEGSLNGFSAAYARLIAEAAL